jgi:MFS family permease
MRMNRNINLFYLFNFFVDFRFYAPVAIIYFAHVSGSYALGMSIFSATMLSSALFEIPTGVFSDYIGRKKTILLGSLFLAFAVFCYALGFSYWVLLLGAITEGVSRSFFSGNNTALLYDTLNENGKVCIYHEVLGKTSSTDQLALAVSAVAGSLIASKSFSLVFWLSILAPVACILISLLFREPKVHKRESTNI